MELRVPEGRDWLADAIWLLLMERVQASRKNPAKCRRDGIGALRRSLETPAATEAAPGVPFLRPASMVLQHKAASVLAEHCRFCGACELAHAKA